MVLEYLPTNWDYLENYINGVNVGKYSSTMDSLGYQHVPNIWVNEITTSLFSLTGIMVCKGNHPKMAATFRLVKYYNLPRNMVSSQSNIQWFQHVPNMVSIPHFLASLSHVFLFIISSFFLGEVYTFLVGWDL